MANMYSIMYNKMSKLISELAKDGTDKTMTKYFIDGTIPDDIKVYLSDPEIAQWFDIKLNAARVKHEYWKLCKELDKANTKLADYENRHIQFTR